MDDLIDVNAGGFNVKVPSTIPLDSELPGVEFTVDNSLLGVATIKNLRVNQEKISEFNLDPGRWYGI